MPAVPQVEPLVPKNEEFYEYETYDDGDAGWAWVAKQGNRVLILSTNHENEFEANLDRDAFKERITK